MRHWKKVAHRVAAYLERQLEAARAISPQPERGDDATVEIHPFRGYGTPSTLHILGRVLRQPRIAPAAGSGTAWSNLAESFRRLASEELVAATVVAEIGGAVFESKTDDEG
jgi:hypothetical protein